MSFIVEIKVRCDHRTNAEDPRTQCRQMLVYKRVNEGGLSPTYVADMTRQNGWWVAGQTTTSTPKNARCPEHKPEQGAK